MEIEELKDYYKARVEPYGKSMNEIMEEVAKETEAYKRLEEENKKLKIEIGGLMGERDGKQMRIDELEQCNLNLQEWLDNKEKVNKSLREENKKLKSDLEECECSMHFENDEVGYRKRECKKLKAELSKYKKQYEHSMGEDDELIYEEGLYD